MNKRVIAERALLKAGYPVNSRNFVKTDVYETAMKIIEYSELDIQRKLNLKDMERLATLTEVVDSHNAFYKDYWHKNPNMKVYQLPNDFIEYVGSERSDVNATIISDKVLVFPKHEYAIIDNSLDGVFWFRYKAKIKFEEFPEIASTFVVLYVAHELVSIYKPNDKNRIPALIREMNEELRNFMEIQNMNAPMKVRRGNTSWRY